MMYELQLQLLVCIGKLMTIGAGEQQKTQNIEVDQLGRLLH